MSDRGIEPLLEYLQYPVLPLHQSGNAVDLGIEPSAPDLQPGMLTMYTNRPKAPTQNRNEIYFLLKSCSNH